MKKFKQLLMLTAVLTVAGCSQPEKENLTRESSTASTTSSSEVQASTTSSLTESSASESSSSTALIESSTRTVSSTSISSARASESTGTLASSTTALNQWGDTLIEGVDFYLDPNGERVAIDHSHYIDSLTGGQGWWLEYGMTDPHDYIAKYGYDWSYLDQYLAESSSQEEISSYGDLTDEQKEIQRHNEAMAQKIKPEAQMNYDWSQKVYPAEEDLVE